jgi:hypothetical protein
MKITRVYTGPDEESHFEDVELELRDLGRVGRMTGLQAATGIVFRETDGDYNLDFHTAPRRQYVINLSGSVELEAGDGTKRLLRPGDVLLAEDLSGRGHISRAIESGLRRSIFVTLD